MSIADATAYSIGSPTDMEQYYVEMINWARANPNGEAQLLANTTDASVLAAYSYFGVNLNMMVTQFAAIPAVPPVSINSELTAAARVHSQDMLTNNYQGHVGTDNSEPWDRITAQGYSWSTVGENVFASVTSPFYGEAGLEVDWGGSSSTGGMQSPAGHRANTHDASFYEIGVGVVLGSNTSVGPQVLTQDFATQTTATPFITGVAYYDLNANGSYDMGEGIGGITVTVSGADYYAVTSTSGGYSVPVPGNGTYTVTFTAPGMPTQQNSVTVSGSNNVKVDCAPAYTPPTISGSSTLTSGQTGTFNFSTVGAATGYQYMASTLTPYTYVEGAESGTSGVTISSSAGYSVIESDLVRDGSYSFHLAQPEPVLQSIQLNHLLRVSANSTLSFWSLLGWAGSGQVAEAQVSADGGNTWQTVWSQAGTNSAGQTSFAPQSVSLAAFAGQNVVIRFVYDYTTGTYYPQTSTPVGFYLDDIAVSNAQELTNTTTASAGNGSFQFSTQSSGTFLLAVQALLPGRTLPWGPGKTVTIQSPQPTVTLAVAANPSNGGSVSGGGSFIAGSQQTITATPNSGWLFTSWNDGNTQSARTVTVPVNGGTFTATFNHAPVAANIITPANGSAMTSGQVTFTWGGGVGVTSYYLAVGSKPAGQDIFYRAVTGSSQTVSLPLDGRTIYVSLYSTINGVLQGTYTSYTALNAQSQILTVNGVAMTSGNIASQAATFAWSKGTGVTANYLIVGSALNGYDIFNGYVSGGSQSVKLPVDGRTVYVCLSSMINGSWYSTYYTFKAPTITPSMATMASVTTGTTVLTGTTGTLTGRVAVFAWNPGTLAGGYFLTIGSKPGGQDIYGAGQNMALTRSVNVPVDGRQLYVTLSTLINGTWSSNSYTYTAFSAQAKITTVNGLPIGNQLPSGSVTFAWSAGTGVTYTPGGSYYLFIGSSPGTQDCYVKQLTANTVTIPNLPQDGRTLYIELYTYINGTWIPQYYVIKAG